MVDVQTIGVLVTATSVSVAAIYYIMTLRVQQTNMKETMNNRRATLSSNMMQYSGSEEWSLRWLDVMHMKWSDFDDFKKKYDSSTNPVYCAKRSSVLNRYDLLGHQFRSGILSLNDFGSFLGYTIVLVWLKFKPVIEEYRETEWPKNTYSDYEYLANALLKKFLEDDPEFLRKVTASESAGLIDQ